MKRLASNCWNREIVCDIVKKSTSWEGKDIDQKERDPCLGCWWTRWKSISTCSVHSWKTSLSFSKKVKDFIVSNVNSTSFVIMRGCLRKMSPDVSNQRSQTRKRKCTISRFRIWARNYKLFLAFLGRGEDLKNTHKPVVDFQPLISLAQLESE